MSPEANAAFIAGLFTLPVLMIKVWEIISNRKAKIKYNKASDLGSPTYQDLLQSNLDYIQAELKPFRCAYWAASNGENTLDGYSKKKLSLVVESNSPEADNVKDQMQNVPTEAFKRNMDLLKSEDYINTKEWTYHDELSNIQRAYGMQECYFFKVKNLKKNIWTGILVIGFEERGNELAETELGLVQFEVKKIEGIISQL